MGLKWRRFLVSFFVFACVGALRAQAPGPTSGEITVQLVQGLNSAVNPKGMSQGRVTKSTNPAVPVGSSAMMGLGSDPVNGGYAVKLLQLGINGQTVPAASSSVVLAPDFFNKGLEMTRNKNGPKDSASGTYVFLPEKMIVRFTLTAQPAAEPVAQRPPQRPAETKPQVWKIDSVGETADSGAEVIQQGALLEGTVAYRNTTAKAYLVMHCDFPTKSYPTLLPLETILGVNPEMLTAPGAPGAPVDLSDFATSQLGNTAAIHTSANGQNRSNGGRVKYFYDATDMQAIVNGGGQTLRLSLGSEGSPDTVAQFTLPADNTAVKGIMSACLQKSVAAAQALQDKTVASCPSKSGDFLYNVELKYSDGKPVTFAADDLDNGGQWKIAAPLKGRTARSMVMTCTYRKADSADGSNSPEEHETVAVPATAKSCSFTVAATKTRSSATCLSITANAADALVASNASQSRSVASSSAHASNAATNGSTSSLDGPAGPVVPVNRLNVRGISVRMGRGQILAAAKAAGMIVVSNTTEQLKLVDPTVNAPSGTQAYGLIMLVNLKNDTAVTVNVGEQGGAKSATFEDLSKKWGKPSSLPNGWDIEMGAPGGKATWGDRKTIYADYNPSLYSFGGQTVTIYDAVALAPHPQARKSVPM